MTPIPPPYVPPERPNPTMRTIRTLWQTLSGVLLAVPGAILAANQIAEQSGSDWRVPAGAWVWAAVGGGFVFAISAGWNAYDNARGKG